MNGAQRSVLFVGGTGTISASCVGAAVREGLAVSVLNRGRSAAVRPVPAGVRLFEADASDADSVGRVLQGEHFDAVVNVMVFTAEQARAAVKLYHDLTDQYVHISTAAMYRKPITSWPIVESTPRHNPFCAYARDKIAAEDVFLQAHEGSGFPVTIVRPSHTYDDARPPLPGDWTAVDRMLRGAPIVVSGDGTSLWTITHAEDLAVGLVGLLGNRAAVGETFHITSDYYYTWDQIYTAFAERLGVSAELVHIPSELIVQAEPKWMWSELLLGDLSHSAVFDNSKIRRFVPEYAPRITLHTGVERLVTWRAEHAALATGDAEVESIYDRLVQAHAKAREIFAAAGR